jgi:hypothetical protein
MCVKALVVAEWGRGRDQAVVSPRGCRTVDQRHGLVRRLLSPSRLQEAN